MSAYDAGDTFERAMVGALRPTLAAERAREVPPAAMGYEVQAEIHRGAQGIVYRAWHAATKRTVAFKVPAVSATLTGAQRARFDREIELLASIQHPGVVSIYDTGTTGDGRPFIAMELVEGEPIDAFAAGARREPGTGRREIVRVMAAVCRAVEAAHQRGIIHRDLKPANILVDAQGQPHVLDFGIARLRDAGPAITMAGAFVGTLAYAAPEQVAGGEAAVDTRTDVYALGVILHELLTGEAPYDLGESVKSAIDAITTASARHAGVDVLSREHRAVLDMAMSKEPTRRYPSAGLLAGDLERLLESRPLRARGDGVGYRAKLLVRRHPFLSTAVAVGVAAAAIGGTLVTRSTLRAARADAAKASTVDAIIAALGQANQDSPDLRAKMPTIVEFLGEAENIMRERLADYPDEQTRLLTSIAQAHGSRGEFDAAMRVMREVIATRERTLGRQHEGVARARIRLGQLLWRQEKRTEARAELEVALPVLESRLGAEHDDTLEAVQLAGAIAIRDQRFADAETIFARLVSAYDHKPPASGVLTMANAWSMLAAAQRGQCQYATSLASARRAHELLTADAATREVKEVAATLEFIVANLMSLERAAEAEPLAREAVRIRERWFSPEDVQFVVAQSQLAAVLRRLGGEGRTTEERRQLQDAHALAARVLEVRQRFYATSKDHELIAEAQSLLGRIEMRLGALERAEELLRSALEMRQRLHTGGDGRRVARSQALLGECLSLRGRTAEGVALLDQAISVMERSPGCAGAIELAEARRVRAAAASE